MTNADDIIIGITESLKHAGVEKIILFGSFAYGNPHEGSDLDIIVVSSDNHIPSTNSENMKLHHKYNLPIRKFRKLISIDLLVYTRQMYNKFLASESLFSIEIKEKGKVLYEAI